MNFQFVTEIKYPLLSNKMVCCGTLLIYFKTKDLHAKGKETLRC